MAVSEIGEASTLVNDGELPDLLFVEGGPTVQSSQVAAAWVACALDGEGMIGVFKGKAATQSGVAYSAKVVVTNNSLDFLSRFNQLVGGGCKLGTKPKEPGRKQGYRIQLPSRLLVSVLDACLPYFVVKRRQALLVIAFRKLVDNLPHHGCAGHEAYERIYQECKVLNSRGE